ncbi:MAG: ABC transporter permease [Anaerolineales bacterium]|jgi:peptide/nickel transport system permease protein|nr:ABC transporter permease [Anaerolineales bacterium]
MEERTRNLFKELLSSGSGKVGIAFIIALIIISLGVIIIYPPDFGLKYWSNPVLWADNPRAAPPAWTNLFSSYNQAETVIFETNIPTERIPGVSTTKVLYTFNLNHKADEPPSFISMTVGNIKYNNRPPVLIVNIERPDGNKIELYRLIVPGPLPNEVTPFARFSETPFRIQLSGNHEVVSAVSNFLKQEFDVSISNQDLLLSGVDIAVFGTPQDDGKFDVLMGVYKIQVDAFLYNEDDSIGSVKFVAGGSVHGFMGTDTLGRDLSIGLLFGFPVALFIGLVASSITTVIGTSLGIISGYIGGKTDTSIQRAADIFTNIPLLPILIFLSFIVGPNLFIIILILIIFSWPGLTILIRSMVLQIRSGQLVESSITLGASRLRIMLRHIFPQTAPFVFAQMIFFTPSAILAEAALSFLGLGDPSLPTWGQILEYGFRNGGIYVGYWWWILPPGILIVITAMTFVLIALGMEPIINPRLKRGH